jgi:hypothetical protein
MPWQVVQFLCNLGLILVQALTGGRRYHLPFRFEHANALGRGGLLRIDFRQL